MSSYSAPRDPFPRRTGGGMPNLRTKALIPTIVILVVLGVLFAIFTNFWTDRLWFDSVGYLSVFTKTLVTRIGLFIVFGLVFALAIFANLAVAYRLRPPYRAMSSEQQALDRYRDIIDPHKLLFGSAVAIVLGLIAGSSAAGRWDTFLQWQNAVSFGVTDPRFGLDVSFYMFGYPWYRFLLGFGFALVVVSLVAALIAHYVYGGIRLQTQGQKASAAAQAHVSVLLGLFVLLKAVAYWFDRYGTMLASGSISDGHAFTGLKYAADNALLPAKTILTFIAVICALLFFANVIRRTWLLPALGFGLLFLSAILLGWAWPAVIQSVQVVPSEPDYERDYIEWNIAATRDAYGVDDAEVTPYRARTELDEAGLAEDNDAIPGIRLVDPTVVGPTFEQLQQVRGFYSFSRTLDVDRYDIDGRSRDAVVALREIDLEGVAADQRNWNNDHTTFTHGYGFVAAYGDERGSEGNPDWMEGGLPPEGDLSRAVGEYQPRVYFGERSPEYSFVGAPDSADPVEMDIPSGSDQEQQLYTYTGEGGVAVGSFLNRVLYASKFQDINILLSGRINSDSKVLYHRDPRERIEKVAPWLSVDSDAYPAIVDGEIKWIVDAYTMSDQYPMSERLNLANAVSDSLTPAPPIAGQQIDRVNYVRNSVKAVVDAYDGTVELYEWEEDDPVLQTWMGAFPDTVQPRSAIPDALLDHLRYPTDMMKLQREILGQYHVTNPNTFYQGQERWRIPSDPSDAESQNKQPAYYLSVKMPDQDEPTFSLTSTYIFTGRQNLAAFVAVDADARSEDYGTIRVLEVIGTEDADGNEGETGQDQVDGPRQIANKLESDNAVAEALLPFTRGEADATRGNLLTLPIAGGLLYVQPVYVERPGEGAYPLLRLVLTSFGGDIGVGVTLEDSLDLLFEGGTDEVDEIDVSEPGEEDPPEDETPPDDEEDPDRGEVPGDDEELPQDVAQELDRAAEAFANADQALEEGDLGSYQEYLAEARDAINRAIRLQQQAEEGGT